MKKFYSISQYPGKTGFIFYSYFFNKYNIDATYTPIGCDTINFESTFNNLKSIAYGISISMPYKQEVTKLLSQTSLEVLNYNSCNTVDLHTASAVGYNTDLHGVMAAVEHIRHFDNVIILGNGCIGKMFYKYMKGLGYKHVRMISRSLDNYEKRHDICDVLINCTSLGTVNTESPVAKLHENTKLVIDVSIKLGSLYEQASNKGIRYFSGLDFYKHQFKKQFQIYTSINLTMDEIHTVPYND